MTKVCICQICTCGRHRCPHHPNVSKGPSQKTCMLTEYSRRFTPKHTEIATSFKPSQEPYHGTGEISKDTTNRIDYVSHPVEKRQLRAPEMYQKPDGRMEDLSSYKQEFIKKDLPRTKAFKPDYSRRLAGNFEGTPTYKADYRRWSPQPLDRVQKDTGYRPPSAPFAGRSGYNSDYQPKCMPVRASMKPPYILKDSQPFAGDTSYTVDFPQKPLPQREMREKALYVPNKAPLDGLSSYANDFIPKQAEKLPSCKPDGGPHMSDAPFRDDTTQRVDYQKWPLERPYVREAQGYCKPDGKMEDMTTSHLAYDKKPLIPQPPAKPMERVAVPGKFFSDTTQKADFKRWTPIPNNKVRKSEGYCPPDAPFEGLSNYTNDYVRHKGAMRPSMKPQDINQASNVPFDDQTGYKIDYAQKPLPARECREKVQWAPNKARFEGNTNYTDSYIPKATERLQNFKPDQSRKNANLPFQDATTQRTDFQAWQPEMPYVHAPETYVPPEGAFDDRTTHNITFTPKAMEPTKQFKPASVKREPGHFDGHTTYNGDFMKKNLPPQRVERKSEYVPPDAPFQGNSSYTDNFVRHPGALRSSMKPIQNPISSAAFDGTTMYNTDYYKKEVPQCPALLVETEKSNFRFSEKDLTGHIWYDKMPTPPSHDPQSQRVD